MTDRAQIEAQIQAAAWAAVAQLGWRDAAKLLREAANDIERKQWEGPKSR